MLHRKRTFKVENRKIGCNFVGFCGQFCVEWKKFLIQYLDHNLTINHLLTRVAVVLKYDESKF